MHNFVRGLSPFPTAWTTLDGLKFKIFKTAKEGFSEYTPPQYETDLEAIPTGKFISDGKTYLKIITSDGFIQLLDVQLEGRKRMNIRDFLNGYRLS